MQRSRQHVALRRQQRHARPVGMLWAGGWVMEAGGHGACAPISKSMDNPIDSLFPIGARANQIYIIYIHTSATWLFQYHTNYLCIIERCLQKALVVIQGLSFTRTHVLSGIH